MYSVKAIQLLRDKFGRLIVNSGYRCPNHNRAVGGADNSRHMICDAYDVDTVGWSDKKKEEFVIEAEAVGFNGIGIASNFIHIDFRSNKARWTY